MSHKGSPDFPGSWGELADLLRDTHQSLARAGAAGARDDEVVALSRAARKAVRRAEIDLEEAVAEVSLLARDARSLAARSL